MAKHDGGSGCKSASGTALTVLTLNTWGLWLIAKKRAERMRWVQGVLARAGWRVASGASCAPNGRPTTTPTN
jgi:hypothetical protein